MKTAFKESKSIILSPLAWIECFSSEKILKTIFGPYPEGLYLGNRYKPVLTKDNPGYYQDIVLKKVYKEIKTSVTCCMESIEPVEELVKCEFGHYFKNEQPLDIYDAYGTLLVSKADIPYLVTEPNVPIYSINLLLQIIQSHIDETRAFKNKSDKIIGWREAFIRNAVQSFTPVTVQEIQAIELEIERANRKDKRTAFDFLLTKLIEKKEAELDGRIEWFLSEACSFISEHVMSIHQNPYELLEVVYRDGIIIVRSKGDFRILDWKRLKDEEIEREKKNAEARINNS